jgi:hypothetical protein
LTGSYNAYISKTIRRSVTVYVRRKAVVGLLFYLVQILGKLENFARPVLDLSLPEAGEDDLKEVLESLKNRVSVTRTEGGVNIVLEVELMMEFIEEYLRIEYSGEGGATAALQKVDTEVSGVAVKGAMMLPGRYVYVTFSSKTDANGDRMFEELAENIAPNHLIILTAMGELKVYYSKPRFVGENKVLWGKVVLLPASFLLEKVANIRDAVDFEFSDKNVKFTLMTKY